MKVNETYTGNSKYIGQRGKVDRIHRSGIDGSLQYALRFDKPVLGRNTFKLEDLDRLAVKKVPKKWLTSEEEKTAAAALSERWWLVTVPSSPYVPRSLQLMSTPPCFRKGKK